MRKKETIKEVMEKAEVQVEKKKKEVKSFTNGILKRIDTKAKNVDSIKYIKVREVIEKALQDIETLINEEEIKEKQNRTLRKILSKYSEADIHMYLNQFNEAK